ncbi:ATPase, V1/A1 complex, subunit E [Syncephalis plumigaleata]|nr:ATPase, V1/A1 complex, subunit E [Syncephalis plumigaleata]
MSNPHSLNDAEVDAEMDKLIGFINKDAKDKAQEIKDRANEEFNINKGKIVMQESLQIDANAQRKMKQAEVQQKIAQSTLTNKARLQTLAERENLLSELFEKVREELKLIPDNDGNAYGTLLKNLLLQSFYQLMEKEVSVTCREADVALVETAMEQAKQEYENACHQIIEPVLDHDNYLPKTSAGGVIVSALNGRIKCSNTLESRLDLLSEQMLPDIRILLFGPSPSRRFYN